MFDSLSPQQVPSPTMKSNTLLITNNSTPDFTQKLQGNAYNQCNGKKLCWLYFQEAQGISLLSFVHLYVLIYIMP